MRYTGSDLQKEAKDLIKKFHENVASDQKIIDDVVLLLMVVNDHEYFAAMCRFSEKEPMLLLKSEDKLYYVGKWGQIPAALVQQHEQGTKGPKGSQEVTRSSILLFKNLKTIIALGVCGTMGKLGDVIVSSRIDECNYKAMDDQLIGRANKCQPGKNIYGFLKDACALWSFQCTKEDTEDYSAVAVLKPMLSGTPLVASGEYRDKLIAFLSPEAGGVEMEGIGVISGIDIVNKRDKIEFIIVKAGCDFADELKSKEWQPVAAMAAADFVYEQLNNKKIALNWFLGKFPRS